MSTIWAAIKKRRGSSNTNLTTAEVGKPPSGRSSVSRESRESSRNLRASSVQQEKSVDRPSEEEDEEQNSTEDGCLKVSRLAGQVLPRSGFHPGRFPAAFYRGLKTASLPRRLPSNSDLPPTPVSTPEPQLLKPPVPDSPKPFIKGFPKRAASASPSRIDGGEKRKVFRGFSRDRLPAPLKNFLRSRQAKAPPPEVLPPKPARRPGPVGKSWVKVYDDITYMDEPSKEEIIPILGYTGFPTVVPDADPLPVAPTPPPQRLTQNLPTLSATPTVDNVDNQAEKLSKEKERRAQEGEEEEIEEVEWTNKEEEKKLNEEREEQQEDNRNGWKRRDKSTEANERKITGTAATRQGRSREVSRFKGKRNKRPGTPLSWEPHNGYEHQESNGIEREISSSVAQSNNALTQNEPEEVIEDGYIIPQSLKPSKPPRKSKSRDSIRNLLEDKSQCVGALTPEENQISKITEEPPRPKRGVKIYESIVIKIEDNKIKREDEETVVKGDKIEDSAYKPEVGKEDNEKKKKILPQKPRRGIKIYETIQIGIIYEPKEDERTNEKFDTKTEEKIEENSKQEIKVLELKASENLSTEVEHEEMNATATFPPRPLRGNKIYGVIKLPPSDKFPSGTPSDTEEKEKEATEKGIGKVVKENDIQEVDNIEILKDESSKQELGIANEKNEIEEVIAIEKNNKEGEEGNESPLYARIKKTNRSKDRNQDLQLPLEKDPSPPPIPPKKRGIKVIPLNSQEVLYDVLPPRPPRHLKPRPHSLETSPPRPTRHKPATLLNGDTTPYKPARGTKVASTISAANINENIIIPRKPRSKRRNKVVKIEDVAKMFEDERHSSLPRKPMRHHHGSLPAPPRRKKVDKSGEEEQQTTNKLAVDPLRGTNVTADYSQDLYENANIKDGKLVFKCLPGNRSRPPPPPPPTNNIKLGTDKEIPDEITANHFQQNSLPTTRDASIENGEIESDISAQRESDSEANDAHIVSLSRSYDRAFSETGEAKVSGSKLDTDIDRNLKKIESSFETLDIVLQSLKNYSRTSPYTVLSENKILDFDINVDISETTDSEGPSVSNAISDKKSDVLKGESDLLVNDEINSAVSLDSEVCSDVSFSDADTVISLEKELLQSQSNTSIENISEFAVETSDTFVSDLKGKNIEHSKAIVNRPEIDTEIPLKLKSTETSTFEFKTFDEPKESIIVDTQVPLNLSSTETSTFKFEPINELDEKVENSSFIVDTEVPLKLSSTETSTFKFNDSSLIVDTEVPLKLSSTETSTFKFKPIDELEVESEKSTFVVDTEVPLKLSSSETSTFILEPVEEPAVKYEESNIIVDTEVPLKLSSTETSTFKFETIDEPEVKFEASLLTVDTEIPLKLSSSETSTFKFVPIVEREVESKESTLVVDTEVPLKLSSSEISTFIFKPIDEPALKSEESNPVVDTEVPFKSIDESEGKSKESSKISPIVDTEVPLKLSSTETSTFKFDPQHSEVVPEAVHSKSEVPLKSLSQNTEIPSHKLDESDIKLKEIPYSDKENYTSTNLQNLKSASNISLSKPIEIKIEEIKPKEPSLVQYLRIILVPTEKSNISAQSDISTKSDSSIPSTQSTISQLLEKDSTSAKSVDDKSLETVKKLSTDVSHEEIIENDAYLEKCGSNEDLSEQSNDITVIESKVATSEGKDNTEFESEISKESTESEISNDIEKGNQNVDFAQLNEAAHSTDILVDVNSCAAELKNEKSNNFTQESVSEIATRLEGIRSQLDAVINSYASTPDSNQFLSDPSASENTTISPSSSSRSSFDFTAPDSPLSFSSFYSPSSNLSQSNFSLCSTPQTFYTAVSNTDDSSSFLSDSRTNTPSPGSISSSSIQADEDELTSSDEHGAL